MAANRDLDHLVEILKIRGDRAVREETARQLQGYGDAAVEKLGGLLMESSGVTAEIAASTLSKIGVSAIPALAKALREGGHERRKYASIALANVGNAAI
ncbi:MAG TPA: HEAT repeat domain-containing protein, partial [Dehalococcoidia bacterium]|nr:HEAT repeat domain-containing protein [Dehalococcoidia bacterium]